MKRTDLPGFWFPVIWMVFWSIVGLGVLGFTGWAIYRFVMAYT